MNFNQTARNWIIRALLFAGLAGLIFACVVLLKRTVPFEIQTLLDPQNPARLQYEDDLKSFNDEANSWLAISRKEPFSASEIQTLSDQIADYMDRDEAFENVSGPQNAKYFEFEGADFRLTPFLEDGEWTRSAREKLNTDLWKDKLVTNEDRSFLIGFRFRKDLSRRAEKPAVDRLESYLTELRSKNTGVETALLGAKVASAAFLGEMIFQQKVITPLLIVVLGFFLWLCYRSWQIVLWNFFTMFVSYAATLCLIIWIEGGLGPYSSFTLMFSFIVATTDLVHFFARFQQLEGTVEERLKKAVKIAYVPCLLTSLTTAAGFIALMINQNLPIRYFGLYCAFSCLLEWVLIFYVLPPVLLAFNFNPGRFRWDLFSVAKQIGPWIEKRLNAIVIGSLVCLLALTAGSFMLKIDDNFYTKFIKSHSLSQAIDLFSREFRFVGSIDVIIKTKDLNLHSKDLVRDLKALDQELLKHPVVSKLSSYQQVEEELMRSLEASTVEPSRRAEFQASVTQMLLDYGGLRAFYNEQKGELRSVVFLKSLASEDLDQVLKRIEELKVIYKDKFEIRAAGFSVIRSFINSRVIHDFFESFLLSFVLIFACYLWLYRSFKWSLLALIPNALPILAISGLMGLFQIPVDTNLVILICVVFGIAGDNTIHLTYVLRQERAKGLTYDQALEKAWKLIGVAMLGTCGAFLFCLPVFLLGSLKLFNEIAIFLSIAFIAAFFADTILFPAFQMKMGSRRHE